MRNSLLGARLDSAYAAANRADYALVDLKRDLRDAVRRKDASAVADLVVRVAEAKANADMFHAAYIRAEEKYLNS